jgi:hypothetical protein
MDSSACQPAFADVKYCHNGGIAFAHHHGVGLPGVHDADHGPFRRSPENSRFAGEKLQSPGSVPFGGSNRLVCLFFCRREKYWHNGGMSFAHEQGGDGAESKKAILAPSRGL